MAATAIWLLCAMAYSSTPIRMPLVSLFLVIFLGVIFFQATPLPRTIVKAISPVSAEASQTQIALLKEMNIQSEIPEHLRICEDSATISTSPGATKMSFYLMCTYVGIFMVMLNSIRTWPHVKQVVEIILGFGFVLAVISILHSFSGSNDIFWFYNPRQGGTVFGPFSNRNHYAFHMTMIFSLALAMLMASLRFLQLRQASDWREALASLSTQRASRLALLAFVMIITGSSICISLSRGATACLAAALGIAVIMEARKHGGNTARNLAISAILLTIFAFVVWLGWEPFIRRIGTLRDVAHDPLANSRTIATLDTLKILGAFPLLGCGFGAFRHTFPMFQSERIQFGRFLHAHNDWAQLLAEGGIIAGVLTALIMLVYISNIFDKRKYTIHIAWVFARWMSVAFIAVALHSFIDYSLHKPSNAMLLSALLGITAAAVHIPADDHRPVNRTHPADNDTIPVTNLTKRIFLILILTLITAVTVTEMDIGRGEMAFIRLEYAKRLSRKAYTDKQLEYYAQDGLKESATIRAYSKGYADTARETSVILQEWALEQSINPVVRLQLAREALLHAACAVCSAPADKLGWLVLARNQQLLGFWPESDISIQRANELSVRKNAILSKTPETNADK